MPKQKKNTFVLPILPSRWTARESKNYDSWIANKNLRRSCIIFFFLREQLRHRAHLQCTNQIQCVVPNCFCALKINQVVRSESLFVQYVLLQRRFEWANKFSSSSNSQSVVFRWIILQCVWMPTSSMHPVSDSCFFTYLTSYRSQF